MILLGIGFIMIAGIFPVAIQQTAAVTSETQGSAVIRDAIKKIQAAANAEVAGPNGTNTLFPVTLIGTAPAIASFPNAAPNNLMAAIGSDIFYSADPRYGWVGFYRRDSLTNPFAQVFVIALQNPNFPKYLDNTKTPPATVPPPIPPSTYGTAPPTSASISAAFTYDPNAKVTTVQLSEFAATNVPNGATGSFLLVANSAPPNMIGRFFRLGTVPPGATFNSTTQTFYLQPGSDLTDADAAMLGGDTFTANVWLIGTAPLPNATGGFSGPFTGPNQDIAAGSAFIRVNTSNN